MELQAEQLQANYDELISYIEKYIESPRKEKVLDFYKQYEDRLILLPAAHKAAYHSAFAGGYVFHVLNVIKNAIVSFDVWGRAGSNLEGITLDNVVFCALNHDLGKMGSKDEDAVFPSQDEWRKKNLGELYKFNTNLSYMSVPDRSLFLLQEAGIEMSQDEWVAIKTHDGLYNEANTPYFKSFIPENKLRSPLALIIHEADLRAAYIEWQQQYLPTIGEDKKPAKRSFTANKSKALSSVKSAGLKNMLDNL
jgi:hypothetical protein